MDNSCLLSSLLLHEDPAAYELYIKYVMNAGWMKDTVFPVSPAKANMINVIECAIIAAEQLQESRVQHKWFECLSRCEHHYSRQPNKCQC